MSERPFFAVRAEERVNRVVESALRLMGWEESVIAYRGYGSSRQVRVMGRVVLAPPRPKNPLEKGLQDVINRRGWRNFFVSPAVRAPYRLHVGDQVVAGRADRAGYIDHRVPDHGLPVGEQEIGIETRQSGEVPSVVQIVADDMKFGIVSDIDDTILTTFLPRPFIAAWNSFVLTEQARTAIPGMAEMYQRLLAEHPGAPLVYVSTGSFDTVPFLNRFLRRHGYPVGPLLMTDWGPTNTGWFRSGMEHKARSLRELVRDFPKIKWVLVGDDGQHDPAIYADFAAEQPKRVRAIAIRQLSPTEQFLAHGSTEELPEAAETSTPKEVRAPDGFALLPLLRPLLKKKRKEDLAEDARLHHGATVVDAPGTTPAI